MRLAGLESVRLVEGTPVLVFDSEESAQAGLARLTAPVIQLGELSCFKMWQLRGLRGQSGRARQAAARGLPEGVLARVEMHGVEVG